MDVVRRLADRNLTIFAILNCPHWILGWWYFTDRAIFNLDLAMPILVARWSLPAAVALLVILWGLDLVFSIAVIFHFSSPEEVLRSIRFANEIAWQHYLSPSGILIALPFVAAALLFCLRRPDHAFSNYLGIGVFAFTIAIFDIFNGSTFLVGRSVWMTDLNVAKSPLIVLASNALKPDDEKTFDRQMRKLPDTATAVGRADIPGWINAHPDRGVLLVLVESLGVHRNPKVRESLQNALYSGGMQARFGLQAANIPFWGSTTAAELRELCGVRGMYLNLVRGPDQDDCIPRALSGHGYLPTGIHGFAGRMFFRDQWWPKTGLREMLFAPDLEARGMSSCGGAFVGTCDSEVLAAAVELVAAPRRFVYVLTLNSHLPLRHESVPEGTRKMCDEQGLEAADCILNSKLIRVLHSIDTAMTKLPDERLPLVIVVGDHAPPFWEQSLRETYSQTHVPAFILRPRGQ